ncbi:MAG TPA: TetR/AcrR family transcriptional regulator, partial [Anaerolineae bacterium]|nr:TetR/AcrR family transcriptional regulator [Anaerolineae bacterium]
PTPKSRIERSREISPNNTLTNSSNGLIHYQTQVSINFVHIPLLTSPLISIKILIEQAFNQKTEIITTMPRTPAQNEQIRAATQQNIITAALTLFAQHGFAHTSIRRIAQQADISVGLTYHYFASKEALLQAVIDHCMQPIHTAFNDAYNPDAPPQQRLTATLQAIFTLLGQNPHFWQLFYMLRPQPAIDVLLGDYFRQWTTSLRAYFVMDLTALGHPQPTIAAYLLYSLIEGTIQQYLLDPDNYPLATVSQEIINQYTQINPST